MNCGLYCEAPNLSNAIVLNTPKHLEGLKPIEGILDIFKGIVEAWVPDYGGVIDRESRKSRHFIPGSPFVDWMTYVPNREIQIEKLPSSAEAFRIGSGWIVVTQREPIDNANVDHIRNVRAVEKLIL